MLGAAFSFGCKKKPAQEQEAPPATIKAPSSKPPKEDGNTKMPPTTASKQPKPSSSGGSSGGGNPASMAVMRGKQITNVKGLMYNLGKFYQQYTLENNRAPTKLEEFTSYIQRDSRPLVQALQDGEITLTLSSQLNSNVVLAYETKPYVDGTRVVLMGDGSVSTMSTQDFQAALNSR
jgi:hypothetical protein